MKSSVSHAILVFLLVGSTALLSGCGSGGLASVSGSVTYQGKPATGASVHFRREGATAEEAAIFPIGLVDADGNFELETAGVGKGAVPGRYKVLIRWPSEKVIDASGSSAAGSASRKKDPKSDSDRLNYRYFQADKPLLTAEVKAQANKLDPFELKD